MKHGALVLAQVSAFIFSFTSMVHAFVSFGDTGFLHPDGGSNGRTNVGVHLETDGAGNWVAATTGPHVSISSDNGLTWTVPVLVAPGGGAPGFWAFEPMVKTDGQGTWLLVWAGDLDGLGGGTDSEVFLSRSTDNGATWSTGVPFASNAASDTVYDNRPRLATDGSGNWMAVWHTADPVNGDDDLIFSTSTDNGLTWSPVAFIDPFAAFDGSQDDGFPSVATDGMGAWVVVYNNNPGATGRLRTFRSNDFGASWSGPVQTTTTLGLAVADIASAGPGTFVIAHTNTNFNIGRSTNGGATWTTKPISGDFPAAQSRARLASDGQGGWVAIWATTVDSAGMSGSDFDIVLSRSADNGVGWTSPGFLDAANASADNDEDGWAVVATDRAGTWIAAWQHGSSSQDLLTARSDALCPLTRRNDCTESIAAGKAKVSLSDNSDNVKDKVKFKVSKGDLTETADFGDPTQMGALTFCMWDSQADVDRLVWQVVLPAGGICAGAPCWEQTSSGFSYFDKFLENGAFMKAKLTAAAAGKASVSLAGKGVKLSTPGMPFQNDTSLAVQLISQETNRCWGANFSTPKKNDTGKYVAKAD